MERGRWEEGKGRSFSSPLDRLSLPVVYRTLNLNSLSSIPPHSISKQILKEASVEERDVEEKYVDNRESM